METGFAYLIFVYNNMELISKIFYPYSRKC